jgi:hypothetical protein
VISSLPMSDLNPYTSSSQHQFGTAEFETAGPDHCKFCNQPVGIQYYRVNEAMACASCADKLKRELPVDTAGGYMRGLLFGSGAALAGMALYSTVAIVTGWEIGFVALAVGWMVGKAMMKGSNGFGGRKYQFTAVALTYMAVSVAAIPTMIYLSTQTPAKSAATVESAGKKTSGSEANPDTRPAEPAPVGNKSEAATTKAEDSDGKADSGNAEAPMSMGMALLTLLGIGLASPFLALAEPGQGIIGLIILFVGINTAWKLTAASAIEVDGPIDNSASLTAKAGG